MSTPDSKISNPNRGTEAFRPYARLISILGDQLITSKWVGVIELVKNCYDADANEVSVRFLNFDVSGKEPVIEIEDDGDGMTLDTILNVWMKPATPNKLNQKKKSDQHRYTKKGRMMQGDKGVGRFAIYKLGNYVEIFTKTETTNEINLTLNFREYAQNDEFADEDDGPQKFLDEIQNEWSVNESPICITNERGKGTLIRISDFRNDWKYDDLEKLEVAFQRMIPPVIPNFKEVIVRDFDVKLFWNGDRYSTSLMKFEKIIDLSPFSFEGSIDAAGKLTYIYKHNKKEVISEIDLFANSEAATHDVWRLPFFRDQFLTDTTKDRNRPIIIRKPTGEESATKDRWIVRRRPQCGECSFFFYAFDWKNKLELKSVEEAFIKDNSVYLYRDFTRVYPFGEKGIDWLLLSKLRGEGRAGDYFSYNDLIGFIFISQKNNPKLRDAADREGLVNIDGAYDDFVALVQGALKVMKDFVDLDKRRDEIKRERPFIDANQKFESAFSQLKETLIDIGDKKSLSQIHDLVKVTRDFVEQYREKVLITQELAGVGMAVEKSSHDIFILIRKLSQHTNDVVARFEKGRLAPDGLKKFFDDLIENLEFLYQEVQILQPLFRVARRVTKEVSVRDTIERVQRYYKRDLQFNINFQIVGSGDIVIRTNLGLMLQVFINLIDNSIYWLNQKNSGKREIVVKIDSAKRQVIVADNGAGISDDSAEIVFLEFYSTKADGRGLGLYIVKELLDRINGEVSLITTDDHKILPGANFLLQFSEVK